MCVKGKGLVYCIRIVFVMYIFTYVDVGHGVIGRITDAEVSLADWRVLFCNVRLLRIDRDVQCVWCSLSYTVSAFSKYK